MVGKISKRSKSGPMRKGGKPTGKRPVKSFKKNSRKSLPKKVVKKVQEKVEEEEVIEPVSDESLSDSNSDADEEDALLSHVNDDQESDSDDDNQDNVDDIEAEDYDDEDFSMHLKDLEQLKEKDAKFYEFLKQNDSSLLDFHTQMEDGNEDDDEDEPEDEEMEMEEEAENTVTLNMCRSWKKSLLKGKAIKALSTILQAFKCTAYFDQEDFTGPFEIPDDKVYNAIVLLAVKYTPLVLSSYLYGNADGRTPNQLPFTTKKWSRVNRLVKSFLKSLLQIIKTTSNKTVLRYLLKECQSNMIAMCLASFPKIGKDFFKEWTKTWAGASDERENVSAFMCIRKLAIVAPNPFMNQAFKACYKTLLETSKRTSSLTWQHLNFMTHSFVELCALHTPSAYQFAYVSLRGLAMQLRKGVVGSTQGEEVYSQVYNWSFFHAVRVWSRVLQSGNANTGSGDKKEALKELIYPLVQIALGALRLCPSPRFFPFRLSIIKELILLSKATETFIPVASFLLDIFDSSLFTGTAKPSTLKPLDFAVHLHAPKAYLGNRVYYKGVVEETLEALWTYFSAWGGSISFPEMIVPSVISLRRVNKRMKDSWARGQIQQLVNKLEENAKFIEKTRASVSFAPKDVDQVASFMKESSGSPLIKFNESRVKVNSVVRAASAASEKSKANENGPKKQTKKQKEDSDEEDIVEDGFELDEEEQDSDEQQQEDFEGDEDRVEDFQMSDSDSE